jgi:hypothetical protein
MKMKRQATLIAVAAIVGSVVAACGNDHSTAQMSNTPPPPSMPSNTQVDTGEFLTSYANQASETDTPLEVNGGVFMFTDISDTSTPVAVN